jgi:hypothetical protein
MYWKHLNCPHQKLEVFSHILFPELEIKKYYAVKPVKNLGSKNL